VRLNLSKEYRNECNTGHAENSPFVKKDGNYVSASCGLATSKRKRHLCFPSL